MMFWASLEYLSRIQPSGPSLFVGIIPFCSASAPSALKYSRVPGCIPPIIAFITFWISADGSVGVSFVSGANSVASPEAKALSFGIGPLQDRIKDGLDGAGEPRGRRNPLAIASVEDREPGPESGNLCVCEEPGANGSLLWRAFAVECPCHPTEGPTVAGGFGSAPAAFHAAAHTAPTGADVVPH